MPEAFPSEVRPRLLFYVQHLLGVGHLVRAARIAKAAAEHDFDVLLVAGGPLPPGLDVGNAAIARLPPVKAGSDGFSQLVHPDGTPFTSADQARRTANLIALFDDFAPDVLAIEAYPFGRRQMRFELQPLLDHARGRARRPLIASSVRDILQGNRRADRVAETVAAVERYFDLVLVHGDPAMIRFDASFPAAEGFRKKIVYTGLVAPPPPVVVDGTEAPAVVVSVGGGAVGGPLLKAALQARAMTRLADRPWLVLTGPNVEPGFVEGLAPDAGIVIRPFIPDLAAVLAGAAVSVSQAGYNTVADLLVTGCRAVLIPYVGDGETEQSQRAAHLASLGLAIVVAEKGLTPERLAQGIDAALDQAVRARTVALDGAAATSRILLQRLAAEAPSHA